ncbi:MAG TPA: dihydrofolate reductase family protein [Gemmatimonadales bacterium]
MKATVFIGISLDGFIARVDGGLDWLPQDGGEEHGYEAFMATVDALVIGRKTYETVLTFDAWPYGEKPVYVLSTRSLKPPPSNARMEQLSGDPHDIVRQLEERGVDHIYVDGGITIQGFLRAGLIQRLIITRIPVLLGEGIPLFGPLPHDVRLEHVATRQYRTGLVQSEYQVLPSSYQTHTIDLGG